MQQQFGLLWLDGRRAPVWQEPVSQAASSPSPPNQTPWVAYTFRRGGFWQPQLVWNPPYGVALSDQPKWVQYVFRPGGYWKPSLVLPLPAAPPWPELADAPPWVAYTFRPGGFWQIQKSLVITVGRIDLGTADVAALDSSYVGSGTLKISRRTDITYYQIRHKKPPHELDEPKAVVDVATIETELAMRIRDLRLEALWLGGVITDDEYFALRST